MTSDHRAVIQEWNKDNPTYDFILADVHHNADGCRVSFTRYVMKDDCIPHTEHLRLNFPYAAQPRYRFFDDKVHVIAHHRVVHDAVAEPHRARIERARQARERAV